MKRYVSEIIRRGALIQRQQFQETGQQVVIVDQLPLALGGFIRFVQFGQLTEKFSKMIVFGQEDVLEELPGIGTFAEQVGNRLLAGKALSCLSETGLNANEVDEVLGIAAIQNRESRLQADGLAIAPEQHVRHGVERPTHDPVALRADQQAHPSQHFLGRLSRERQEQDGGRIDARIDQPGHAIHEDPGFAAAGTGNDQRRTFDDFHRGELLGIQFPGVITRKRFERCLGTLQHVDFGIGIDGVHHGYAGN